MRIFIYEFLTAQGIGQAPDSAEHGMYLEGRAMRGAVLEDFSRIPETEAFAFPDDASPVSREAFEVRCKNSDWTILIAPAFDGCLHELAESVQRVGGRLLGPSLDTIALTSDKFELFNHWRRHRIATPATSEREPTGCEAFPIVWKPRDGAGSTLTFKLNSAQDVARAKAVVEAENQRGPMIVQEYVPGQAASIAFVCGPQDNVPLLPASQALSEDGRYSYLGGEIPISPKLARRAIELGQLAIDSFPGLMGYVGIDLVLGRAEDGSQDYAIEVNPRLTTSYVGLRKLANFNCAEAMLQAATGVLKTHLDWEAESVCFQANGSVQKVKLQTPL